MIREPAVGMRVEVEKPSCDFHKKHAKIFKLEAGDWIWVEFENGYTWPYFSRHLTEIKESDMEKGDLVVMAKEGSYYKNGDICRLLKFDGNSWWAEAVNTREDSWATQTCIGEGYFMKLQDQPEPKVKELTVADIEEMVGGPWKIVKE